MDPKEVAKKAILAWIESDAMAWIPTFFEFDALDDIDDEAWESEYQRVDEAALEAVYNILVGVKHKVANA